MFKKDKAEKDTPKENKVPKKLKEFYEGKNSLKKFKALTSYCDSSPSADEIKSFFEKEAYNVWSVFLDTFQHYEQQSSKSKKLEGRTIHLFAYCNSRYRETTADSKTNFNLSKSQDQREMADKKYLYVIVVFLFNVKANIVERVLYKDNHHQIRILGLELLLLFLSDLEVPDPPQTNILACAIDMEIFLSSYNKKIVLPNKVPIATETSPALYPSNAAPTVEDSVAMFDAFLEFMGIHTESFDLMWGLFKKHYLVVLYPELAKSLSLIDKFSDIGFPGHCPYEIQVMFINKLASLMNLEPIMKAMWTSKENIAILQEIYRQSCLLPMEYVEAIKNSIALFRRMLLGSKKDPIPKIVSEAENLLGLQQFFIEQLPNVFVTETKPQTAEQQVTLCLEIFQMFKQTFERNEALPTEIRDVLLFTLLEVSKTLLKPDNPNQDLAKSLASVTVDTLLFTWITSKIMDSEMWTRLQEGIQLLFHRIEPITQSKLKLIQLSLIIRDFIYPPTQGKKKANKPTAANKDKLLPAMTPDYRKIVVPANDTSLTALNWNFDTAYFVWEALLNVFRNVNRIKDPALHSEAMGCLLEVMDIFLAAESKTPFKQVEETPQPPISLISKLGKWFFEACYLDDKYLQGKAKAFAALCRLICRNLKALPGLYPEGLLPHFYSAIHYALCNPANDDTLSCTLIDNSYNIFNLALEGASVLIPYYLIEIKRLFTSNHPPPVETRKKALILVGSLLCFPSHFGDLDIPVKFLGYMTKQKSKELWDIDERITFTQLREFLASLLSLILRVDDNVEIRCMALWDLYVLILDCIHFYPNVEFIKGVLKDIFNYTLAQDHVGLTALDALTALTQVASTVLEVDTTIFPLVVDGICSSAEIGLADKQREVDDKGIQHHFFTLTEIVLAVPSLLDDSEIVTKIFNCAQNAIRHAERSRDTTSSLSVSTPQQSKDPKKTPKNRRETDQPTTTPGVAPQKVTTTRDAARCLIANLMAFHKTFPAIPGAEFGCSILNESDDNGPADPHEITHWIYANDALLSFVEIDGKNGKTARLFMRGPLGKFVWNFNLNTASTQYHSEAESIIPFPDPQKAPEPYIPTAYDPKPGARQLKNRQPGTITLYNNNNPAENDGNIDKLDELLQYLGEAHAELIPNGQKTLNQPTLLPKKYLQQIMTLQNSIKTQTQDDIKVIEDKQKPTGKVLNVLPPKEISPLHKYHNVRMLLSQLGMLHPSNLQDIQPIDNSKAFQLRLRNLDKTYNRDTLKVGLLYVAPGQETQEAILENDANVKPPSNLYAEFAAGLGWNVDLASHKGYNGGLDPGSANHGKVALYYCNSTMELVYHEVLKLPTIENDPHKQLHKKRHVGNDIVHIVWSEHGRDYSTKTISGQFNDAHIIVYPCSNGLFRIQIAKKDKVGHYANISNIEKVPPFGPLVHGMAVPKRLLPILVRQSAINAHRYIRLGTEGYDKPYFTRYSLIQEIISKAAVKPNYEEFVLSVIKPEAKVKASPSSPTPTQPNSPPVPRLGSNPQAEEECLANS